VKSYPGKTITVHFEKDKCIHCGDCLQGLPAVFELGRKPWIRTDLATDEEITEQVSKCPSGALSVEKTAKAEE
jgi:uncharacterized Fe-S cluster protein YjdI